MSGYRFCRTDDVPLLVDAYNRCCAAQCRDTPEMTVDDFRRDTRELNLWASSCMIAFAGGEVIGVLLAAKRDTENLVVHIGIRPDHQGRGHGRHLLESLSRKLAILGPPRLRAEIPAGGSRVRRFFESCSYEPRARYADFLREGGPARFGSGDAATRVTLEEILECGAFDRGVERAWERSLPTLLNRRDQLEGLAVGSERVEAWLLHRPNAGLGTREIVALGCADGEAGAALLGALVHRVASTAAEPITVPRLSTREVPLSLLESWGFRATQEYVGYEARASPE